MTMILVILLIVTGLAYLSQRESMKYTQTDGRKHWDIFLILLIIFLVLFAGLRTAYNDTANYAKGFQNSVTIREFLSDSDNLDLLHNPLFYGFQALIRTFTDNTSVFFIICALVVNILNVRFIKRNTDTQDFAMSMFLYVTLGTLMLSLAAQKQSLAMSVLTLALTQLFDKHYVKYYIIVFIAGLIHSYAWLFLFLPLLDCKPWTIRTYILLLGTIIIMNTFEGTIMTIIEVADQIGKNVSIDEVFDGNRMNIFRVLVYAMIPLATLIFKKMLDEQLERKECIFIQMCIISLMFMMMGTMNGANMFGRSANYFEMGMICVMPVMIRKLFTKKSAFIVFVISILCFSSFYLYDSKNFNIEYRHKTITQFIQEVI